MIKIFGVFLFVSLVNNCISSNVTSSLQMGYLDTILHSNESELIPQQMRFIQSNVNWSMNPCENFYDFACGNYENNEMLSSEERKISPQRLRSLFGSKLFINSLNKSTNTNTKLRQTKIFYQSCFDKNQQFDKDFRFRLNLMEEKLTNATNLDWMDLSVLFWNSTGDTYFIDFHMDTDYKSFVIKAPIPTLNLDFFRLKVIDFHQIAKDAKLEEQEKFKLEEEFNKAKEFEKNLIKLYEYNTKIIEKFTFDEFIKNHPNDLVDWSRFFDKVFNGNLNMTWTIKNYVKRFDKIVEFLKNSNKETLLSYIKWSEIAASYSIHNWWKSNSNACFKPMTYSLPFEQSDLILSESQRNDIIRIINRIRTELLSSIDGNDSFDEQTKLDLKLKLQTMKVIFDDSEEVVKEQEPVELSEHFLRNFDILETNYNVNRLKALIHNSFEPYNREKNYYPDRNTLLLRSENYPKPFYSINFPAAMKYSIIAYELLVPIQRILDIKRMRNLTNIKSCLRDQNDEWKDSITPREEQYHYLEDLIRNNIMLEASYNAFLKENHFENISGSFPALNFTSKQLFYLQYLQNFCGAQSAFAINSNVAIKNSKDFGEVFKCQSGARMNPEKKCRVL